MRVPEGKQVNTAMWSAWQAVAARLSLKYNIFIGVNCDKNTDKLGNFIEERIYFIVDDHKFDSLADLQRALKLKAFL